MQNNSALRAPHRKVKAFFLFAIFAVYALVVLLAMMTGCTVDRQMVQAEVQAAANASGCLCVASKCAAVVSASGNAALSGEAAASARQVTRELTR